MTRSAPGRLRYALGRPPRALGWGLAALAGLAAAGLLVWAQQGARPWPAAAGLLLWLAVGAGALQCWRQWPEGWLEWDGCQWWLQRGHGALPQALPAAPRVCWDGRDFLLLHASGRLRGGGWLWLHSASAPASWGDLRRAVYWRADDLPA